MVDTAHGLEHSRATIFEVKLRNGQKHAPFYQRYGKRLFDVAFTLAVSPIVITVVAFMWCALRMQGQAAFFGQSRVGRDGASFRCWKMQTMVPGAEDILRDYLAQNPKAAEEWARDHKLRFDPRITKLGAFLRKTSLDEFPQFWNVLKGDMSLVGPRPIVPEELPKYGRYEVDYLSMKPGVTGLWQVSGRNDIAYADRVKLDVAYRRRMGFAKDCAIVLRTVVTIFKRTGL